MNPAYFAPLPAINADKRSATPLWLAWHSQVPESKDNRAPTQCTEESEAFWISRTRQYCGFFCTSDLGIR